MNKAQMVIILGAAILVIGSLLLYGYLETMGDTPKVPTACTADARICPDGSSVGRVPPTCAFAPCPGTEGHGANTADTLTWLTYTSESYGYSFQYPEGYTLEEQENSTRVTLTPPEEFDGPGHWFSVVTILYPDVKKENLPEAIFNEGVYPNGELAWFKEPRVFKYENYHIATDNVTIGTHAYEALRVRENSIIEGRGEFRSVTYILNKPLIYRLTRNLSAETRSAKILNRIEESFTMQ